MLNQRAARLCEELRGQTADLRIDYSTHESEATIFDFGVESRGGLEAGLWLARICMAGFGEISLHPANRQVGPWPSVVVRTDHPVTACMASQYAGWQLATDDYFGMGSGPMRAAAGREELFDSIGLREDTPEVVGVIESAALPTNAVVKKIVDACKVEPYKATVCVAPTNSYAGTVQIVARSVETALHKLFDLGFDLHRVESGFGCAPLPPLASDDLAAIGRTNDAILYGADVTLWVRGDDESLEEIVANVPSNSSTDHGQPFGEIFSRYDQDFYKIDPHLFSPASISLVNVDTGNSFGAGELLPEVLRQSFEG